MFVDPSKSQCSSMSDGESFECFGENDMMSSTTATDPHNNSTGTLVDGVDLELAPHFQKYVGIFVFANFVRNCNEKLLIKWLLFYYLILQWSWQEFNVTPYMGANKFTRITWKVRHLCYDTIIEVGHKLTWERYYDDKFW